LVSAAPALQLLGEFLRGVGVFRQRRRVVAERVQCLVEIAVVVDQVCVPQAGQRGASGDGVVQFAVVDLASDPLELSPVGMEGELAQILDEVGDGVPVGVGHQQEAAHVDLG